MPHSKKVDYNKIYSDCYIYKISCLDSSILDFYIGSTVNFIARKSCHKTNCRLRPNTKLYAFINEFGGWDNWTMEIIEHIKDINLKDKKQIEKKYIDNFKPRLNKNIIGRDVRQYQRDHKEKINLYNKKRRLMNLEKNREYLRNRYQANKEKYQESARRNYQKNKQKITEKRHTMIKCLCGREIKHYTRVQCIKSEKHKESLKKIFENITCIQ